MALVARKRARMADRDRAVEMINAAYAEGQLTTQQREDRVHRALVATHLGDLDQVTADLQTSESEAPKSAESAPTGWWERTSRRTKVAIAGVLLVAIGSGVAVAEMGGGPDSAPVAVETSSYVPATADGVAGLIADQKAEFGTTKSYGVNLQRELSMVEVPTQDGRARYQQWTVAGGDFEKNGEVTGAGDHIEFDLAEVDLKALEQQIDRAWKTLGVPEPTHATLVIQHWDQDDEPRISINVTNKYEEYGYVVTDLGGRVIEERPFDPTSP